VTARRPETLSGGQWDVVIADEAHRLRSPRAVRPGGWLAPCARATCCCSPRRRWRTR